MLLMTLPGRVSLASFYKLETRGSEWVSNLLKVTQPAEALEYKPRCRPAMPVCCLSGRACLPHRRREEAAGTGRVANRLWSTLQWSTYAHNGHLPVRRDRRPPEGQSGEKLILPSSRTHVNSISQQSELPSSQPDPGHFSPPPQPPQSKPPPPCLPWTVEIALKLVSLAPPSPH